MPKQFLSNPEQENIIQILKNRYEKTKLKDVVWNSVEIKLRQQPEKLRALNEMEKTGGEPNLIDFCPDSNEYLFFDCSAESPIGRRSLCYDKAAWIARKENKPNNNAVDVAAEMKIEILDETDYRFLQTKGQFDTKTSSWLKTPLELRQLGGAIFGDFRYNHVFIYHNGVQSYYAARGFRGKILI
jgi:Protein of unknown function (DUF4256)